MSDYKTITFDEEAGGWTSFHTFYPENMIGMNGEFYSFKEGALYKHHSDNVPRNNFYGEQFTSKVSTVINTEPSTVKELIALSLEGTVAWDTIIKAYVSSEDDFTETTIGDTEFVKKEGIWYAYAPRNTQVLQECSKSMYGIGVITDIDDDVITVNGYNQALTVTDQIVKTSDMSIIGVVTDVDGGVLDKETVITLSVVTGLSVGDHIAGIKNPKIEGGNLRGYAMRFDLESSDTDKVELFAVNAEVIKSYI